MKYADIKQEDVRDAITRSDKKETILKCPCCGGQLLVNGKGMIPIDWLTSWQIKMCAVAILNCAKCFNIKLISLAGLMEVDN